MSAEPMPELDLSAFEDAPLEPLYGSVLAWFEGWFGQVIERQQGSYSVWCAQWWQHPEAICCLEALWRSWESARVADEQDAMLTWWERAHSMLAVLMSRDSGPFSMCSRTDHKCSTDLQLPHQTPPEGWFGLPSFGTD